MKKILSLLILSFTITLCANASVIVNNRYVTKSIKEKNSTKKIPITFEVCNISEIVYHPDGSYEVTIRCRMVTIDFEMFFT